MSLVVGMSAFGRSSAALVRDGRWLATATEELLSRRKDDPSIPAAAMQWCLEQDSIDRANLDYVVFAEKPVQRFIRILGGLATGFPGTIRSFPGTIKTWLGGRLWLKPTLAETLGVPPEKLLFLEHAVAKATSAFLTSPFDEACIVLVDNAVEWSAASIHRGSRRADGASLQAIAEIQHPHSLVGFLEAVALHVQVPECGGLRWLAALAAHGEPVHREELEELVPEEPDGAYSLNPRAFRFDGGPTRFVRHLRDRFRDYRRSDLARSAGEVAAERCVALVKSARERTDAGNLCLGGKLFAYPGVLERVLAESPFDAVHVDPHLDEVAAAVGAALYVDRIIEGNSSPDIAAVSSQSTAEEPTSSRFSLETVDEEQLVSEAIELVRAGKIVGWAQDTPELGLRLVGKRALLAAAIPETVERLRQEVKLSEDYTPFAILTTAAQRLQWAEQVKAVEDDRVPIKLPAGLLPDCAVHVDGSALVHAVPGDGLLHRLLVEFSRKSGQPPALLITSMNRSGDPPALTLEDAAEVFSRAGLDALYWGGRRLCYQPEQRTEAPSAALTPDR